LPDARLLAGVYAARTDFGVDHAIAGIVDGISTAVSAAVSTAVVAIAGKPVVVTVSAPAMATPTVSTPTMTTAEVMTAAVKATTTTEVMTATKATGGRGSDEGCGRSERDDYEKKLTKHFDLHLCGAGCTVSMVRSYAADTGRAVREITQAI
jgi:hypothetical protein